MRPTMRLPLMLSGVGTDCEVLVEPLVELLPTFVAGRVTGAAAGAGGGALAIGAAAEAASVVFAARQQLLAVPKAGSPKTLLSHNAWLVKTLVTAVPVVPYLTSRVPENSQTVPSLAHWIQSPDAVPVDEFDGVGVLELPPNELPLEVDVEPELATGAPDTGRASGSTDSSPPPAQPTRRTADAKATKRCGPKRSALKVDMNLIWRVTTGQVFKLEQCRL